MKKILALTISIFCIIGIFTFTACLSDEDTPFDIALSAIKSAGFTVEIRYIGTNTQEEIQGYLDDNQFDMNCPANHATYLMIMRTQRMFNAFSENFMFNSPDLVLFELDNVENALEFAVIFTDELSRPGWLVYRSENIVFHGSTRGIAVIRNAIGGTRYS